MKEIVAVFESMHDTVIFECEKIISTFLSSHFTTDIDTFTRRDMEKVTEMSGLHPSLVRFARYITKWDVIRLEQNFAYLHMETKIEEADERADDIVAKAVQVMADGRKKVQEAEDNAARALARVRTYFTLKSLVSDEIFEVEATEYFAGVESGEYADDIIKLMKVENRYAKQRRSTDSAD